MRLAVSATNKGLFSMLDPRFAGCPYFLIVDIKDKKIDNFQNIKNVHHIGNTNRSFKVANLLELFHVDVIITSSIGKDGFEEARKKGMHIFKGHGLMHQVLRDFVNAKLPEIIRPTESGFTPSERIYYAESGPGKAET